MALHSHELAAASFLISRSRSPAAVVLGSVTARSIFAPIPGPWAAPDHPDCHDRRSARGTRRCRCRARPRRQSTPRCRCAATSSSSFPSSLHARRQPWPLPWKERSSSREHPRHSQEAQSSVDGEQLCLERVEAQLGAAGFAPHVPERRYEDLARAEPTSLGNLRNRAMDRPRNPASDVFILP